jgi:predicted TIM-barrel fold metal-dependent hydrolase
MEYARPFLLDEAARAFPRLPIILSGFASPFASETVALMAKHDRVFTTTAGIAAKPWALLHALQSARDWGVDGKILFASGFPFDTPARAAESVYAVNAMLAGTGLPLVSRAALRDIVERDSISLLGLGAVPPPRAALLERTLAAGLLPAPTTVRAMESSTEDSNA